jgi:hypothetical protein
VFVVQQAGVSLSFLMIPVSYLKFRNFCIFFQGENHQKEPSKIINYILTPTEIKKFTTSRLILSSAEN